MTYVASATYAQFRHWYLARSIDPRRAVWVTETNVRGRTITDHDDVVFLGGFWKRPDANELFQALCFAGWRRPVAV